MHIELLVNLVIFTVAIVMYAGVAHQRRPFATIFANAFFGVATLIACAVFGQYISINVNINTFTLGFSAIFGVPGAVFSILLTALQKL